MLLFGKANSRTHLPWLISFIIATAAAAAWYISFAYGMPRLPGGNSRPGWWFGVAGGILMSFEFFLWPRKQLFRTWRIGRAQTWMRAHIWFGCFTVPLIAMHCGFRFGGALSAVLLWLFIIVIISGLYGLVLQQIIPTRMLNEIPAETIYGQIDRVANLFADEADELVDATCGGERRKNQRVDRGGSRGNANSSESHRVVGAERHIGRVQGRVVTTISASLPVPGSEWLGKVYDDEISVYLVKGRESNSPLASSNRAASIFHDIKLKVPPGAHEIVDLLEGLCRQRRQFDRQRTMHAWLHGWLLIHLPLSVALMILMCVHIYVTYVYR